SNQALTITTPSKAIPTYYPSFLPLPSILINLPPPPIQTQKNPTPPNAVNPPPIHSHLPGSNSSACFNPQPLMPTLSSKLLLNLALLFCPSFDFFSASSPFAGSGFSVVVGSMVGVGLTSHIGLTGEP